MPGEGRDVAPPYRRRLVVEGRKYFDIRRDGGYGWRADERHLGVGVSIPCADSRKAAELPSVGVALDRDRQRAKPLGGTYACASAAVFYLFREQY